MTGKPGKATPIDDNLSKLPADQRQVLLSLREVILSVMPDAEEVISYGVPMFKWNGKGVISMSAKKDYCSLHLMSPPLAKAMGSELKPYLKGVTLHFTPDKPLAASLVKKIVKARLKEIKAPLTQSNKTGFTSLDEYIGTFPEEVQRRLEQIREIIKAAAPGAHEKISYQIGAFELNGKNLIGFAGWKNHLSIYPIPAGSESFNKEVAKYADGKGTLKFPLDKPLPLKLINKIVKYRLADHLKNTETKYGKRK